MSAATPAVTQSSSAARRLPCGAAASASCSRLDSRDCTQRSGDGPASASSRRVPTYIARACASGVSSARTPTVSPSSTSAG